MTSKRRLRRNACTGKRVYGDRVAALPHLARIRKRASEAGGAWWRIVAYHCDFGDHWHVGHRG